MQLKKEYVCSSSDGNPGRTLLAELIAAAERDEPLWLPDLRERFSGLEKKDDIILKLLLLDGTEREFVYSVPEWETESERSFLAEYLASSFYNALSALGGESRIVYDESSEKLRALVSEALSCVRSDEFGFSRILRETERISRLTEECRVSSGEADRAGSLPAENSGTSGQSGHRADQSLMLDGILRNTVREALQGVRAGIDIGGTDIKLAVSVDGQLVRTMEYDWNPSSFTTAEEIIAPVLMLTRELLEKTGADSFDGIGLSFPDVVMFDRICGGETPKTEGIRKNRDVDYEEEFLRLAGLGDRLSALCVPGGKVRAANDGSVAAFTAAVELAFSGEASGIANGCFSHALGTSLGTGWIKKSGELPLIPLEFYDSVIDLGSRGKSLLPTEDIRCPRSSSGARSADRYLGQASAFRYAAEEAPELLEEFTESRKTASGESCQVMISSPKDMRKPCLEFLMREAEKGNPRAGRVFFRIGESLGIISREIRYYLRPETDLRFIFGRFAKYPEVFSLLKSGFDTVLPEVSLIRADEDLAFSPLMHSLAERKGVTVAQFGQAVGAIYLSARQ